MRISIGRKHLSILIVVVAVTAVGSANIDVKDQMKVFQSLDMDDNRIINLQDPDQPQDAATKSYVDESGGGSVFYGDGSDGQIVDSSSKTRNGVIHATTYKLESGNTITLDDKYLVIRATDSITIDGTIDGSGVSNNGGDGGAAADQQPQARGKSGGSGAFLPGEPSGGGGSGFRAGYRGGGGGQGDTSDPRLVDIIRSEPTILRMLRSTNDGIAGGGGGGGAGELPRASGNENGDNGSDGEFPGGGGSGGRMAGLSGSTGKGGNGGDGGGLVALMAPRIEVTGTVDVSGTDGADGQRGRGGGGGGGGGSGGLVVLRANSLSDTEANYDLSGGKGGSGGEGEDYHIYDGGPMEYAAVGGDGANGADGSVIRSTP